MLRTIYFVKVTEAGVDFQFLLGCYHELQGQGEADMARLSIPFRMLRMAGIKPGDWVKITVFFQFLLGCYNTPSRGCRRDKE